jgi:hypothetical protein
MLGSGPVDYSQNRTVAARARAGKKRGDGRCCVLPRGRLYYPLERFATDMKAYPHTGKLPKF